MSVIKKNIYHKFRKKALSPLPDSNFAHDATNGLNDPMLKKQFQEQKTPSKQ